MFIPAPAHPYQCLREEICGGKMKWNMRKPQLGEAPVEKNKFENFQAGEVLPSGEDLGGAVVSWAAKEMDAEDPLFILYTKAAVQVNRKALYIQWQVIWFGPTTLL